nr:MAG TPA: hypothetical protein [Caudoviricetes sp.]
MILVESRYFLVAVVGSAVAVIVRGHYQQLGTVLRGLRLLRRTVLDPRGQHRQLLIAPCFFQAGRERHRGVGTFQIPGVFHDLRKVVAGAGGCHNIYSYWFYFLMQI